MTDPAPGSPPASTPGPGPGLDWPSIGLGVVVALAVVVVCDLAKIGADTNSAGLLFLGIVIGFGIGGAIAGRHSRDRYLTHGAVAGALSVAVFLVVAVVARSASGDKVEVVSLVFTALLGTCCGMLGANVGDWRRRKREADAAGDANMSILVIDVGTSSVRASVVHPDATITAEHHREALPDSPAGLVEFDAAALGDIALDLAAKALAEGGPVDGVGIANQRASSIVWDRSTGEPVGPALGWQDLRTIGECLTHQAAGLRFAPNQSATKLAWLLDTYDPDRARDLCFGTPDTWIVRRLSGGSAHVTDLSNVVVTGLTDLAGPGWDDRILDALRIPSAVLPTIVDSSGRLGEATELPGAPPIAGMLGDQQASMLGQGVVAPGPAKITFGTGGMLDVVVGPDRPRFDTRGGSGTFPIVAWRRGGEVTWGLEAIMLSAGTNVEWLRDDLGILSTSEESHAVAAACESSDGVVYVPALLGLGTPQWDYGARGTLLGLTCGVGRPQVVRAVLEGVAQRGADLVDAAEADGHLTIEAVRIDGGMSRNPTFAQAVADATQRPVEISPLVEATTLGAAFAAGLTLGTWSGLDDIAATWAPAATVEPGPPLDRERWADAVRRAGAWFPELSGLDF